MGIRSRSTSAFLCLSLTAFPWLEVVHMGVMAKALRDARTRARTPPSLPLCRVPPMVAFLVEGFCHTAQHPGVSLWNCTHLPCALLRGPRPPAGHSSGDSDGFGLDAPALVRPRLGARRLCQAHTDGWTNARPHTHTHTHTRDRQRRSTVWWHVLFVTGAACTGRWLRCAAGRLWWWTGGWPSRPTRSTLQYVRACTHGRKRVSE
jgi:hypothetical protein